ncbi:MAG: hypothetical protein ACM3KL_08670 [Alphaproteobacteria bacterium]
MKKTLFAALLLPLFTSALALADEWKGWITDEHCGAKGANAGHAPCAKKCLLEGSKLVFYNTGDEKIYNLDNQDLALQNLGHEVTVKGELEGNAVKVASIEPALVR